MAIRVECPSCRSRFGVREDFAGRHGKCPRCQAPIRVPGEPTTRVEAASTSASSSTSTPGRSAFEKEAALSAAIEENPDGYDLAGRPRTKVPVKVATRAQLDRGVAEAVGKTRRTRTPKEILAAFQTQIEPVPTTLAYRLWLLVVASFMFLLPVLYLTVIVTVGYGVYYHATHSHVVFQSARGSGAKGAAIVYFVPLIAGLTILAFLFKPLFARSTKGRESRALDPETEPLLFAFVDGICSSVGAPRPVRIEVDGEVNAGAYLEGGLLGLFRNDLVLVIGLPLVAGLDLRQFAGVLAHEFGHFSQGAGMRVSNMIRGINMWFARVVYERDAWDQWLNNAMTEGGGSGLVVGGMVKLAVWLARRVLWVLMYLGHGVSGMLLRQMEFDADRFEARMVGSTVFTKTCWRLRELDLAQNGAYSDLSTAWRQRRLPDNFPKLVLANVPQIPEEVLTKYRKAMGQATTGLFDTHPADRDRITRARAEGPDGIFTLEGPATDVFRNFDSLARLVTFEFYRNVFGPAVSKEQLFPVAELVQSQAVEKEGYEAFDRFFLHAYSPGQPLPFPFEYPEAPAHPARARATLEAARAEMEANRDDAIEAWKQWREITGQATMAEAAGIMLRAGMKVDPADFDLDEATAHAADDRLQRAERRAAKRLQALAPFTDAAMRRLTTALGLLETDAVVRQIPDGETIREEARALYPCTAHLGSRVTGETPPVFRSNVVLNRMLVVYQQGNNQNNAPLTNAILRTAGTLHARLEEFRWKVGDLIEYPFEHANEGITLARYILAIVPPRDEIGLLIEAADDSVKRMIATYARALGRLTYAAEEVERALGLPPIESEPPPSDDAETDGDD